ncbi:MAG: flavodoxin/nitric oxide synthase [Actinomycetes bacterium]|nr:flavodoxin/nitric oxide synthase [Actinomycetes bacterium]MDX5380848.1 flavodoxin/nitric oxide synthase [Actinomycetes bacterium]MDX5399917.1 flavodoxin/nitric oxide synthase [Actinomycetes bacterium]MDX5450599.1 flavodoxin/nitric oxide synthase [Actinomycetes bacterium]
MKALIVVESMFGNTRAVADAIAEGMKQASPPAEVVVVDVAGASAVVPDEVELLVLGGPTHAFSMTRESTRKDALAKAGSPNGAAKAETGIREWIAAVGPEGTVKVVTFDTRVKKAFIPGSAAKSAAKALEDRGFEHAERGETFWVEDTPGPLKPGEIERAREWGRQLAS